MKKKILIILMILFITINVRAEKFTSNYSYSEAQDIIREVMKAYYLRGPYMQYNFGRATYGTESPEDATSKNTLYSVCAAFTYDVYSEAFGMDFSNTVAKTVESARNDYKNENMVIYYENTKTKTKRINGNSYKFNDLIQILKPGDVISYLSGSSGHNLIVYDLVYTNGKVTDVLLLNSTQGPYIRSRLKGTTQLSYNIFTSKIGSPIFDEYAEGSIKTKKFSTEEKLVKDGVIKCAKNECSIIRGVYDTNGKATFNAKYSSDQYKKSQLRLKFPGIVVTKTVNKNDDNSVNLNNKLVYTIRIKNKSNVSKKYNGKEYASEGVTYKNIVVEEKYMSSLVTFDKFITTEGVMDSTTLTWVIDKLKPGEEAVIQYRVIIKDRNENINKTIVSKGRFYKKGDDTVSIRISTINNKIIPKATSSKALDSYQNCYNQLKSKNSGLKLINEIYKCAWGVDNEFTKFDFKNIIDKKSLVQKKSDGDTIELKSNLDTTNQRFVDMILNNYWSGTIHLNANSDDFEETDEDETFDKGTTLILARWLGDKASKRAETIDKVDFKDGDVLIYSITQYEKNVSYKTNPKDNGLYAFIYLDGKFVGKNSDRDEFTYHYYGETCKDNLKAELYSGCDKLDSSNFETVLEFANYQTLFAKDYYVILRPEIALGTVTKVSVPNVVVNNKGGTTYPKGDVDGNGKTGISDYILVRKHVLGTTTLEGAQFSRADLNGDGKISVLDYIAVRKIIIGS